MTTVPRALHLTSAGAQAADVRRFLTAMCEYRFGTIDDGAGSQLFVSEKSGTPDMSVDVATGFAIVDGTQSATQGYYVCENDGVQNVSISAADPTNDRHDLICIYVLDEDEGAGSSTTVIGATTGTPAASPADPNPPANSVVLARVVVPNAASSITNSDITDLRFTYNAGVSTQTQFRMAPASRIVGYDSANSATTLTNSGWTAVASLAVTFRAHDGYLYEIIWNSGDWEPSHADTRGAWRTTGLVTNDTMANVTFSGGAAGNEEQFTAIAYADDLVGGTTYTVGIEGTCEIAAEEITKGGNTAGKLWVRETFKGY